MTALFFFTNFLNSYYVAKSKRAVTLILVQQPCYIFLMAETCRNRTHLGRVNAPQTVLKTAEATRPHPLPWLLLESLVGDCDIKIFPIKN